MRATPPAEFCFVFVLICLRNTCRERNAGIRISPAWAPNRVWCTPGSDTGVLLLARVDKLQVLGFSLGDLLPMSLATAILPCRSLLVIFALVRVLSPLGMTQLFRLDQRIAL